ncbi:hypothetical protein B0H19DRAFT_1079001 [Mycena capillaripes]|nr:hypothetical protein B0H19DRAFT_1079001 [Mycena capillaripes]
MTALAPFKNMRLTNCKKETRSPISSNVTSGGTHELREGAVWDGVVSGTVRSEGGLTCCGREWYGAGLRHQQGSEGTTQAAASAGLGAQRCGTHALREGAKQGGVVSKARPTARRDSRAAGGSRTGASSSAGFGSGTGGIVSGTGCAAMQDSRPAEGSGTGNVVSGARCAARRDSRAAGGRDASGIIRGVGTHALEEGAVRIASSSAGLAARRRETHGLRKGAAWGGIVGLAGFGAQCCKTHVLREDAVMANQHYLAIPNPTYFLRQSLRQEFP